MGGKTINGTNFKIIGSMWFVSNDKSVEKQIRLMSSPVTANSTHIALDFRDTSEASIPDISTMIAEISTTEDIPKYSSKIGENLK